VKLSKTASDTWAYGGEAIKKVKELRSGINSSKRVMIMWKMM
jgi:hypothetical protein